MNHDLFDWDFENLKHIARHGVTPEEAEEVLLGDTVHLHVEYRGSEQRFGEVGMTRQGRILEVFFTLRHGDASVLSRAMPLVLS